MPNPLGAPYLASPYDWYNGPWAGQVAAYNSWQTLQLFFANALPDAHNHLQNAINNSNGV